MSNTLLGGVFILSSLLKKHIVTVFSDAEKAATIKRDNAKVAALKKKKDQEAFNLVLKEFNNYSSEEKEILKQKFNNLFQILTKNANIITEKTSNGADSLTVPKDTLKKEVKEAISELMSEQQQNTET
jgi:hypothetical protein